MRHPILGCILACFVLARTGWCDDVEAELKAARERIKQLEAQNEEYRKVIKKSEETILDLEGKVRYYLSTITAQEARHAARIAHSEEMLNLRKPPSVRPSEKKLGGELNPPMSLVIGRIASIDAKDPDKVTLTVGEDHGIKKDHTLYVYGMEPEPTYLGLIRITEVSYQSAVGRFERTSVSRRIPLKVGDKVTSDLKYR